MNTLTAAYEAAVIFCLKNSLTDRKFWSRGWTEGAL